MILYKFIEKTVGSISTMEIILGKSPHFFKLDCSMAWLGDLHDYLEVEVVEKKGALGWLYTGGTALLYYSHGTSFYECSLTALKELTEEKLKEKFFSDEPKINHLSRSEDGRITTRISIEDLLSISGKVIINEHRRIH